MSAMPPEPPPPRRTPLLATRGRKIAAATAAAVAIAAPLEGLRQVAYYDPPGILTVCYGSTTDVRKDKVYTKQECEVRLNADMMKAVEAVDRCVPGAPDSVLIAFSDAAYNIGPKVACNTGASTAARYLAAGNWSAACNQLPRWNRARVAGMSVELPGLTKRRALERDVCLKGLL